METKAYLILFCQSHINHPVLVPPQVVASAGQPSAGSILVAVPRISSYRTPRVHVILLRHGKRILLAKVRPSSSNVKWSGVNAIKLFKPDAESSACQLVAVFTGTTKDQAEAKFFELSTWSIDHQVVTYQATHDISSRLTSTSNVLDLHPSADEGTGFEILDSQQFDREVAFFFFLTLDCATSIGNSSYLLRVLLVLTQNPSFRPTRFLNLILSLK